MDLAEHLDARALLYAVSLFIALFTDIVAIAIVTLSRERLGRAASAALAAAALHAAATLIATAAHLLSAESEAAKFGVADGMTIAAVLDIGGPGMAVVHLGGAAVIGLLLVALLRIAPPKA